MASAVPKLTVICYAVVVRGRDISPVVRRPYRELFGVPYGRTCPLRDTAVRIDNNSLLHSVRIWAPSSNWITLPIPKIEESLCERARVWKRSSVNMILRNVRLIKNGNRGICRWRDRRRRRTWNWRRRNRVGVAIVARRIDALQSQDLGTVSDPALICVRFPDLRQPWLAILPILGGRDSLGQRWCGHEDATKHSNQYQRQPYSNHASSP